MPRGGGGGFRGGGLGGGGFRGGGFRGGSRSFRVGSVRRSGRPFGRTGSRRTVSRSPRSRQGRSYHGRRHRRCHYNPSLSFNVCALWETPPNTTAFFKPVCFP